MKINYYKYLLIRFLISCFLTGIFPLFSYSQLSFQNPLTINNLDGLPSNNVTVIKEDDHGFAWIGTTNGLVKTDGLSVEVFQHDDDDSTSINDSYIIDLLPDVMNNKIWVITTSWPAVLDLTTKTFKNYKYSINDPNSVPNAQVLSLLKDKEENIWLGFKDNGLAKYLPKTDNFQLYICNSNNSNPIEPLCNYSANEIEEDPTNTDILWIGTQKGILRFNKITGDYNHYFFNIDYDVVKERYVNAIRKMLVHPNGKIYTGSWYYGISVFDRNTDEFSFLDPCFMNNSKPFEKDVTNDFFISSKSEFWINSRLGLQLFDSESGCITQSYSNDIKSKKWFSINHVDKKGRIWSATAIDGVRIYDPVMHQYENLYFESPDSDYPNYTRKIIEDSINNILYVGSQISRGLYIYDQINKSWKCIPPPPEYRISDKNGLHVHDIAMMDDGSILIIVDANLFWYTPGEKVLKYYPLQPPEFPQMRKVVKGKEGYFWIAGYNVGLIRLDHKNQELTIIDKKKYEKEWNRIVGGDYLVQDANGNIWIREHNGLLIFSPSIDSLVYIPHNPKDLKAYPGMGYIEANANGDIWISTRKDFLAYAHADSISSGIIRIYDREDGMLGTKVYSTYKHGNTLLVFMDNGMQEFDLTSKTFGRFFDGDYGLGGFVSNLTKLSTNELAVGRTKYISIFNPDSLKLNNEVPVPYLSSFKVFNNPIYLDQEINDIDTFYLSHTENFFSIELSALGFSLPEKTKFRYMLEEFDENWQDGTERRYAAYTNVPGGDYRFIVETYDEHGNYSPVSSITYLFVSTVWWKTSWFWVLMIMLISALAYAIYKYNINQIRKEEKIKSNYEKKLADVEMSALRAQMNPHFIFNSLNSIEYYIIKNEPEKASDYLNRFSRLIRLILQNSKSSRVLLKDDLEALKLYIEMESMRFDNLFDYEVRIESGMSMDEIVIPPMLMQPYVENSIWHGLLQKKDSKGKIDLSLRRSNGYLICLIQDNGIGRIAANEIKSKTATRRKSYGMKITSDRLSVLNSLVGGKASVKVHDLYDIKGAPEGTKVELTIPILSTTNQSDHD